MNRYFVNEKLPPEGVDLLVCNFNDDYYQRNYRILKFYKKDSPIYVPEPVDNFIDAPATGFYSIHYCPVHDRCVVEMVDIPTLDMGYIVINPEDE